MTFRRPPSVANPETWMGYAQMLANLADKAQTIYGERYDEFLDSVKSFAYFPYVVAREVADFRGGEISLRFKPLGGRAHQAGSILCDLKPNSDYYARALRHRRVNEQRWSKSGEQTWVIFGER